MDVGSGSDVGRGPRIPAIFITQRKFRNAEGRRFRRKPGRSSNLARRRGLGKIASQQEDEKGEYGNKPSLLEDKRAKNEINQQDHNG